MLNAQGPELRDGLQTRASEKQSPGSGAGGDDVFDIFSDKFWVLHMLIFSTLGPILGRVHSWVQKLLNA